MMGYKMKIKTVKGPDGKDREETGEELLYTPMDIMKLDEKNNWSYTKAGIIAR